MLCEEDMIGLFLLVVTQVESFAVVSYPGIFWRSRLHKAGRERDGDVDVDLLGRFSSNMMNKTSICNTLVKLARQLI